MVDVQIKGLAELERALSELPAKIERNILRGALRAAAKPVADEARRVAARVSGDLQASIRVSSRVRAGRPVAFVKAGDKKAFYAHMVEGGTQAHFIKPKTAKSLFFAGIRKQVVNHPGARKRPFLRPALDVKAGAAVEAFAAHVRKRLTKHGINVPEPIQDDPE